MDYQLYSNRKRLPIIIELPTHKIFYETNFIHPEGKSQIFFRKKKRKIYLLKIKNYIELIIKKKEKDNRERSLIIELFAHKIFHKTNIIHLEGKGRMF